MFHIHSMSLLESDDVPSFLPSFFSVLKDGIRAIVWMYLHVR